MDDGTFYMLGNRSDWSCFQVSVSACKLRDDLLSVYQGFIGLSTHDSL